MTPFDYQKTSRYFAQVAGGMEELGAEEISDLGAMRISGAYRGLYFEAEQAVLYRINYCSRLLTRVLAPLRSFQCHSDRYLYRHARDIDWPAIIPRGQSFAISANVSHSRIRHSQYAALRLKDAVMDQFKSEHRERPAIDRRRPDIRLNLHIENNRATISLDTSGDSLHRRGYRRETVEAPMQETLAAAVVRLSRWDERPLYDPMCGSGTLLCEALMHRTRIPAGFLRERFGFHFLPDFDQALWQKVREQADALIQPLPPGLISGSDESREAVLAAGKNLGTLPFGEAVDLKVAPFQDLPGLEDSVILCNPPYGIRLGNPGEAGILYKAFGDFLKQRCTGATATLYFGNRKMIPKIGLRPSWKRPFFNAGLDGRVAGFEIY